nr:cbb3-type cytochrome c oxidase subunit I [Paenibacillus sp. VKM B-2647]
MALYYMQGLNTTPLHGHMASFGVYGMLGIGLMMFCLRGLTGERPWRTKLLRFSFWSLNIGLLLMGIMSLLPVGILQTMASMDTGCGMRAPPNFCTSLCCKSLCGLERLATPYLPRASSALRFSCSV